MTDRITEFLAVTASDWNQPAPPYAGRRYFGGHAMQPRLDPTGLYRWAEIKPHLPISESAWRRLVAAKTAPQPIKLSRKCTLWRGADVLQWLKNPLEYVEESEEEPTVALDSNDGE